MKVLFFIESLRCGGKERRLLELIQYLKQHTNFEILLVLTEDNIYYHKYVYELSINIRIIKRKGLKKDPRLFFKFYKLCNEFKPDIIHSWGYMLAFYSLPAVMIKKIHHINSHITNAPLNLKRFGFHYFITHFGFTFSRIILANSYAGLKSYGVSGRKCRVIHNGIRLDRFTNLTDKEIVKAKYNLKTAYAVIMVASFTSNKNYNQFLDVAESFLLKRNDITFLGVGDTEKDVLEFDKLKKRAVKLPNVVLIEKIDQIESLINACDVGVLFTYGEGLSNSIMEYMACGKPVIATDAGGTREIITNEKTGFLITNDTTDEIVYLINNLIDNKSLRMEIGENAKLHVKTHFSIERMGEDFIKLYSELHAS